MKPVYVAKTFEEKLEQRALMQFSYPKNYDIVYRALKKAHREDLIGYGPKCLIPPRNGSRDSAKGKTGNPKTYRKTTRPKTANGRRHQR